MELLVYNYTGYETEFEVSVKDKGKITFHYYVTNIDTTLSIDKYEDSCVKINSIEAIIYDENDNPQPYILSQNEIESLEKELPEYIDWISWIDEMSQPDDNHEEFKLNQLD